MKIIVKRLTRGDDLKKELEKIVVEGSIKAGVILSSVGCVSVGRFRVADGERIKKMSEPLEILSLQGTLGKDGLHLHISYGDIGGRAYGGHLVEGNIINTTCELVVGVLQLAFNREFDENTRYKELVVDIF